VSVSITDHAVLRYIERVCGVDVEDLRRRIATDIALAAAAADKTGAPSYAVLIGQHEYRVVKGVLVTVAPRRRRK